MKALRTAVNLVIEWAREQRTDVREWWHACDDDSLAEERITVFGHEFARHPEWDDEDCIVWWSEDLSVELQYHHERNVWVAVQWGLHHGRFGEVARVVGKEAEDALWNFS